MTAQNDTVPKSASSESPAAVVDYYRSVEPALLGQLRGRRVLGSGRDTVDEVSRPNAVQDVPLHILDLTDLDEAIRSGVVCFRLPGLTGPGMTVLRVQPGEGAGIDTVATAALALAQALARDGLATSALTDGSDGLYLIGFCVGEVGSATGAAGYAGALAGSAPEIATTDRSAADGRALVTPLPNETDPHIPSPYSLVPFAGHFGVVVPLTLDEVAAASAGMPLEIEPDAVADRVGSYGDLAAALGEATAAAA